MFPTAAILLFRGVSRLEDHREALALLPCIIPSGPEIEDFYLSSSSYIDVIRANITMKQTDRMDLPQGIHDRHHDGLGFLKRNYAPFLFQVFF
ncbi:MAG: hypothetical protein PHO01_11210 [Desulfotomaculaceae bacterium]|nr:hypothetical protein [Desulfotomaculaceae bacterium]